MPIYIAPQNGESLEMCNNIVENPKSQCMSTYMYKMTTIIFNSSRTIQLHALQPLFHSWCWKMTKTLVKSTLYVSNKNTVRWLTRYVAVPAISRLRSTLDRLTLLHEINIDYHNVRSCGCPLATLVRLAF